MKNTARKAWSALKRKLHLQPGYWLEVERVEVPGRARDKLVLVAVDNLTGRRHVIGALD